MIRRAAPADADAVARVEAAAADHPWTLDAVRGTLGSPAGFGLLAIDDGGAPIGHLIGSAAADEGELLTLAVLPERRRLGVASALHAAAVEVWRERGVTQAFLEVRDDNHGARALYAALGWQPCGRRRAYYADGTDAVLMRRAVAPGLTPP